MKTAISQIFEKTIQTEGDNIYIKPLCDFFKIDTENQVLKIKNDPILANCHAKNSNKMLFGDNYPRFCLDKKGFVRWIQIINPTIIDQNLRANFLIYQELIFDYLYGAAEEQQTIARLNLQLQELRSEYSLIGSEIRITQRNLFDALNRRYQYCLPQERPHKIT
jgi:acyl-ACP thioesterase